MNSRDLSNLAEDRYAKWPRDLLHAFNNKRVVIFVGSGLSCRATSTSKKNAPTWPGLLSELKARAEESGLIKKERSAELDRMLASNSTDDYLIAAAYLKDKFGVGNKSVKQALADILDRFRPDEAHRIISQLPVAGFVSTNYDNYLEESFADANRKQLKVLSAHSKDVLSVVSGNSASPWLVKLHGQIGFSEDFVLSFDDYEEAYATGRIETFLTAMLTRYTVLFVGFGFRDPPIMNVLRTVFQRLGRDFSRHYAFSDASTLDSIKSRFLEKNFNIETIRYPKILPSQGDEKVDRHENFLLWMNNLQRELRLSRPPSARLLIDVRVEGKESETHLFKEIRKRDKAEVFLWPSIEWPHFPPGEVLSKFAQHSFFNAIRDQFMIDGGDFSSISIERIGRTFIDPNKENIAYDGLTYDFYFQFVTVKLKGGSAHYFIQKLSEAMPGLQAMDIDSVNSHEGSRNYNHITIDEFMKL